MHVRHGSNCRTAETPALDMSTISRCSDRFFHPDFRDPKARRVPISSLQKNNTLHELKRRVPESGLWDHSGFIQPLCDTFGNLPLRGTCLHRSPFCIRERDLEVHEMALRLALWPRGMVGRWGTWLQVFLGRIACLVLFLLSLCFVSLGGGCGWTILTSSRASKSRE